MRPAKADRQISPSFNNRPSRPAAASRRGRSGGILQVTAQAKPQLPPAHPFAAAPSGHNLLQQRRKMSFSLLPEQHLTNIAGFRYRPRLQDHQQQRAGSSAAQRQPAAVRRAVPGAGYRSAACAEARRPAGCPRRAPAPAPAGATGTEGAVEASRSTARCPTGSTAAPARQPATTRR